MTSNHNPRLFEISFGEVFDASAGRGVRAIYCPSCGTRHDWHWATDPELIWADITCPCSALLELGIQTPAGLEVA